MLTALVVAFVISRFPPVGDLRAALARAHPSPLALLGSCLIVLATYGMLVESWRIVLGGWGFELPFGQAARIWTISNLGRYLPGKVWAMGTMAVMAQRRGVSGIAAAGSAVVVTLVNTLTGFVVVLAMGARVLPYDRRLWYLLVAIGCAAMVVLPAFLPEVGRVAGRLTGRRVEIPRLPARSVLTAAAASVVAWIAYGVAFRMFTFGVLGSATGATSLYIAVFTGSYLIGFIMLFAPAGAGVREGAMLSALTAAGVPTDAAAILVITSRVWLTVLEILPATFFLALRREPRPIPDADHSAR